MTILPFGRAGRNRPKKSARRRADKAARATAVVRLGSRDVLLTSDSSPTPGGALASCGGKILNGSRWSANRQGGDGFLLVVFGPSGDPLRPPSYHPSGWAALRDAGELPADARAELDRAWER